ncbi:MAG: transposase [Blautia marasmi]
MISHMTDRILPMQKNGKIGRWKKICHCFYGCGTFPCSRRQSNGKKSYVAIGVKLNGKREVLGMWVGGNESAKYWLSVLNEIKNRGVEDIMIVSVDGLTGFGDAIHAVFPQADQDVHQNVITKFIS